MCQGHSLVQERINGDIISFFARRQVWIHPSPENNITGGSWSPSDSYKMFCRSTRFNLQLVFSGSKLDHKGICSENLTNIGDPLFWNAYEQMLPAMRGIFFDKECHDGALVVGRSVTEYEVKACLSSYPVEISKVTGLCWSRRQLVGTIDNKDFSDIRKDNDDNDENNVTNKTLYDNLMEWMLENRLYRLTACYPGGFASKQRLRQREEYC
jgi:hypothetical protein